ncbi:unnamed protein product [Adineta ricciae]|uniref:Peptidase S1 domain-containing protein n=1 Tax=Adineta ricciae TaxID=249248 RepID=A0A815SE08_ADIRI|nr:unnamed protein product [Adineta ricciae]
MSIFVIMSLLVSIPLCQTASFVCDKNLVPCGCGPVSVGINARIVNGENAIQNSWSMIASLRYDASMSYHICGGTILNEYHVLTAAHCVDPSVVGITFKNMSVAFGLFQLSQTNGIIRKINQVFIHPLWNSNARYIANDIAILRLNQSINLDRNSSLTRTCLPVRLNDSEEMLMYPPNNTDLVVIGWGLLNTSGSISDVLQQVTIKLIDQRDRICASTTFDPSSQFCAGLDQGGKGPCYGDSGGPIFQWIGDRWQQVGIVSYGEMGCAVKGYPSVFTRINYFLDWIQFTIQLNNTNQTTLPVNTTQKTIYQCWSEYFACGCSRRNVILSSNQNALPYSWSMVVAIYIQNKYVCTGTILDDYFILTTANCVKSSLPRSITIHAGIYYQTEADAVIRQVDQISIHPNYNFNLHDIAVLRLSESLNIEENIFLSKTCLSSTTDQFNLHSVVVSGWNVMFLSEILQQVQLTTVDRNDPNCSLPIDQQQYQFCVGQNLCVGSNYSNPMFVFDGYHWIQVGLSSYCKVSNTMGVFTRLDVYYDWIWSIVDSHQLERSTVYYCDKRSSCGCGENDVRAELDAENAVVNSWSMIVSIRVYDIHVCSGTILSDLFILTSARCTEILLYYNDTSIVTDIYRLSASVKIIRRIKKFSIHPNYVFNDENSFYDIAILRLDLALPLNNHSLSLRKICVSNTTNEDLQENSVLFMIGWGSLRREDALQQVSTKLIKSQNQFCGNIFVNETYQFCLRSSDNNTDIYSNDLCYGDVGSPILIYKNNHWEQIGIVPYKYYCASVGYPDVYLRLSSHIEWIQNVTNSSLTTYTSINYNNAVDYYHQQNFIFILSSLFIFFLYL